MKICTKCEPPKVFSAFHRDASTKDGYKHQCIKCREAVDLAVGFGEEVERHSRIQR